MQWAKFTNVLPCSTDHNAAHAFIDVRVTHFAPRFKYICNECQYYEKSYVEDCSNLPVSIVYALEDPNQKLYVFSNSSSSSIVTRRWNSQTQLPRDKQLIKHSN